MKAQKYFGVLVILALLFALVPAGSVSAAVTKVAVCHLDDMGAYHLINISEMAFPAHVEHGDAAPGDDVPGVNGKIFGADCGYIDEFGWVETVKVYPTKQTVTYTSPLDLNTQYKFVAHGTFYFTGTVPSDAKCTLRGSVWVDNGTYPQPEYQYGLQIAYFTGSYSWPVTSPAGWIEPCNGAHDYTTYYTGTGASVGLWIYDNNYGDNSNYLTVDIYKHN